MAGFVFPGLARSWNLPGSPAGQSPSRRWRLTWRCCRVSSMQVADTDTTIRYA